MKKIILFAAILLLVIASVGALRESNNSKIETQNVKIELNKNDKEQQKLEDDYKKLEGANAGKEQKVQELEKKRQQLEKEKKQLEAQLQAKAELKRRNLVYAAAAPTVPFTERQSGVKNCGDNIYKQYIYQKESGCNTGATNPIGCFGIGQSCPKSKIAHCGVDFKCQDAWFTNYAVQRYGSWRGAYNFWVANHWW